MIINPFVAGVLSTIFCEMLFIILYAILKSLGGKK